MPEQVFTIKAGNTWPAIEIDLTEGSRSADIPDGAVAIFRFWLEGSEDVKEQPAKLEGSLVTYQWQPGDTDEPGVYNYEVDVKLRDGRMSTFPSAGQNKFFVEKRYGKPAVTAKRTA